MQRILHITGSMDRGGAETMIMNLYRNIDRSKFQFDFIFFTTKESDYEKEILKYGGKIHRILASNPIQQFRQLVTFFKLNRGYKIVHSHTLLNSGLNLFAAKLAGVPNRIAHAHSIRNGDNTGLRHKIYEASMLFLIANFANYRIGCSRSAAKYLFKTNEKILYLPNAVDVKAFLAIKKKEITNNTSDSKLNILQVGRLEEVKNYAFSLALAKQLKKEGFDFTMNFAGKGSLKNEIQENIINYNLGNEVKLLGLRTDIPELMVKADVLIMPSLFEGLPVSLIEAQAIGLPAIISNTVTDEVDLGLELINRLPITGDKSLNLWVEKCLEVKNKDNSYTDDERLIKIEKTGYDIEASAKLLSDLYLSFSHV
ncbi:glycosyltransferase [uncultured Mesonia sp.]|uniref:glycosyltransferase n=1 Tax=uncultured Mesonia sp. TaxID=399731 RepID=UPI00374E9FFF